MGFKIDSWPNPRRVLGFKSIFGVKPGGYREMSGARSFRDVWGANAIISVSFVGYALCLRFHPQRPYAIYHAEQDRLVVHLRELGHALGAVHEHGGRYAGMLL